MLNAKNIPYQTIYINILDKPEWFPQKSPLGRVPVLEIFDKIGTITDSFIIAEYLDEKYPEHKLYPSDAHQRARDKMLIFRFNSVLETVGRIMYPIRSEKKQNVLKVAEELFTGLDIFEQELKKRKTIFFGGTNPGMVDLMIWPWCERMLFFPKIHPEFDLDVTRFEKFVSFSVI